MLREKESKMKEGQIKYIELNKIVKKMRRAKARKKRKDHVLKILNQKKGPKEMHKKWKHKESIHERQRRKEND